MTSRPVTLPTRKEDGSALTAGDVIFAIIHDTRGSRLKQGRIGRQLRDQRDGTSNLTPAAFAVFVLHVNTAHAPEYPREVGYALSSSRLAEVGIHDLDAVDDVIASWVANGWRVEDAEPTNDGEPRWRFFVPWADEDLERDPRRYAVMVYGRGDDG